MALTKKERFRETGLRKKVELGENQLPKPFSYKDREFIVLGLSKNTDLRPDNEEGKQIVLTDQRGNLYEAFIIEKEEGFATIVAMKSVPEK